MAKHIASDAQWSDLANKVKSKVSTSDLLDLLYPVGSYFITSDLNFDPEDLWGGTWELSGEVVTQGGEMWSAIGEVWDSVGGEWELDGNTINRWHRLA